jgi:VanZ family protein
VRAGLEEHGALARGAFAVVVLVSLAVLFAPASDVPTAPAGVDKVVHAVLFLALAFTGRWAGVREAVLVAVLVGYAAVSELVQGLTPLARSATVADWLADVVGVLIGLLVWRLVVRRAAAG